MFGDIYVLAVASKGDYSSCKTKTIDLLRTIEENMIIAHIVNYVSLSHKKTFLTASLCTQMFLRSVSTEEQGEE